MTADAGELLSALTIGQRGRVMGFTVSPEQRQRLLEMGLTVGAEFEVVRFAPLGVTADTLIIRQLRQDSAPQQYTVVSSDHEVQNVARGLGATVLSSHDFASRLAAHPALEEMGQGV